MDSPEGNPRSNGGRGGRKPTGRTRPKEIHSYLNEAELEEVKRLAGRWDLPLAAVIRRALREAAQRERLPSKKS